MSKRKFIFTFKFYVQINHLLFLTKWRYWFRRWNSASPRRCDDLFQLQVSLLVFLLESVTGPLGTKVLRSTEGRGEYVDSPIKVLGSTFWSWHLVSIFTFRKSHKPSKTQFPHLSGGSSSRVLSHCSCKDQIRISIIDRDVVPWT